MGLFLGLILLAAGMAVDVTGRSAAQGRPRRNHVAGIRTRRTPADDEAWRIVHEAAEPWVIAAGLAMTLGGLAELGTDDGELMGAIAVVATGFAGALTVAGAVIGHSELRGRRPS
ncbi:SdpI family protein [Spirillospora sp. NPDC047279]|uniref:SdpI family protein n=1 Tax=Spirillospora sp. NPDC047279 TaxID=3155478 RepID=UPI0033C8D153